MLELAASVLVILLVGVPYVLARLAGTLHDAAHELGELHATLQAMRQDVRQIEEAVTDIRLWEAFWES